MLSTRPGLFALVLGAAVWGQLALVPIVVQAPDVLSILGAVLALGVLIAAVVRSNVAPAQTMFLGLGVFPVALGLAAFLAGRQRLPNFDAPSRVIAALTVLAFALGLVVWNRSLAPRVRLTHASVEDRAPRTGPPLRRLALGVTAFCALFVAVIAPSLLTAREPVTLAERMAGEGLLRGRNALVSAGGLVLALALILNGGNALGRATAPRPRRLSRVGAYLVWAAAAAMMRYWFDHAR